MKWLTLSVSKDDVLDDVKRLSSYVGAKMAEGVDGYDRIYPVDEDAELLEVYWQESKGIVMSRMKKYVMSESEGNDVWRMDLRVSDRFNDQFDDSINRSLRLYFLYSILSRWFMVVNKGEAEAYVVMAQGSLEDLLKRVYFKRNYKDSDLFGEEELAGESLSVVENSDLVCVVGGDGCGGGHYTFSLRLSVQRLLNDIKNKLHLTGEARESESAKNYLTSSVIQGDEDDSDYQLLSSLNSAFGRLCGEVSEWLDRVDPIEGKIDNKIRSAFRLGQPVLLHFRLPSNYRAMSVEELRVSIHDYLVSSVMSDWCQIVDREDSEQWSRKKLESMQSVHRSLFRRSRPERPKVKGKLDKVSKL